MTASNPKKGPKIPGTVWVRGHLSFPVAVSPGLGTLNTGWWQRRYDLHLPTPRRDEKMERLEKAYIALKALSERYLCNAMPGTKFPNPEEFVACITPERGSPTHRVWRNAYDITHPVTRRAAREAKGKR